MAKETPFDRARDFVEEKIDRTKESLGDSYTKARDQFDDVSEDVRKSVKSTAKRIEKDYGYLWDDLRGYVRENPGTRSRSRPRSASSSASCCAATTTSASVPPGRRREAPIIPA